MMHRLKVTLLVSFVIAIFISLFGTCYKNFYRLPNNYNTEYITMKLLHIELELSSNNEGPININNFFTTSENKHFSETYSFSITSILTEDFHKLQYAPGFCCVGVTKVRFGKWRGKSSCGSIFLFY